METIEKLGKYEIRRTLGRGAMGVVYEGWDPTIQRVVAIKTVPITGADDPETQEAIARFRREAQAAGRLTHPNIVAVFDYGETADIAYIVMEFVNGPSLKELMGKNDRFTLPDVVKIMQDVLAGVEHSHEQGVVHRDIKPANLMLTSTDRARARIKISDFGVARIESSSMTQAGVMMGTPTYMSPEQFMSQTVDARTDIYACGVLLYQLLTGERPFEGGLSAIMHKVLNTEPIPPSQLSVNVPPGLDVVVKRAMAKRPTDRFQSAQDFADAIVAAVKAPSPTATDSSLDEATLVARPSAPPPAADMEATMAMASATMPPSVAAAGPASMPPSTVDETVMVRATQPRGRMPLIAGAVAAVLAIAGGGAYLSLRPSPPTQSFAPAQPPAMQTTPPEAAPSPPSSPAPTIQPPPLLSKPAEPPPAPPVQLSKPSEPTPAPPAQLNQPAAPTREPVEETRAPPPPAVTASPAPAGPDIASITERFAQIVFGQACSLLNGSVSDKGTVTLTGIAGPDVRDDIRDALAGAAIPLLWRTTPAERAFCQPLNLLRPIARPFAASTPRFALTLADDLTALHDGQRIRPRLIMPDFPSYLRVDYITHDGDV
ncbi:MAG: protein kinase domain-containing protein [Rhodopila sp.]